MDVKWKSEKVSNFEDFEKVKDLVDLQTAEPAKGKLMALLGKNPAGKFSVLVIDGDGDELEFSDDWDTEAEAKEAAVEALVEATPEGYSALKDKLNIGEDGLGILNMYLEKFAPDAEDDNAALSRALEDFRSDVEEYAMPAIEEMENWLNENS